MNYRPQVRAERSGWRDEAFSREHRKWGYDVPAIDIDFLLVEFAESRAAALVEYKHEDAAAVEIAHPSIKAMLDLAYNRVPVFLVRYTRNFRWYTVQPLNSKAHEHVPQTKTFSRSEYIDLMYRIRGYFLTNFELQEILNSDVA